MHLLVNALSIGSMSGQHVVFGFLRPLATEWRGTHQITVLHTEKEKLPIDLRELGVNSYEVSGTLSHWLKRTAWEIQTLPRIVKQLKANVVLTASGALLPRCPVPQAVLCQNPWCYVPAAQRGLKERLKAWLQKLGYAKAFRKAELMIYISHHLRSLYCKDNPMSQEKNWSVAYVGVDEDTFAAAAQMANLPRIPNSILSVSAMARWKGTDTLIRAVAMMRKVGKEVTVNLVGPWPDAAYRREIDLLIEREQLQNLIHIHGRVEDDTLHRLYATNEIFCLMSECESFGIPAAEAMTFGTPVVSTECCAIAEVCETAGLFGPVNDPAWTANALTALLNDRSKWKQHSNAARERASSILRWNDCSRPFLEIPQLSVAGLYQRV
jgi:glycosyltransferase involved in cell wall biosynthesis